MGHRESTRLRTQISYRFGIPLIYLSGELDQESAGDLRQVIQQELAIGGAGLLLECSELTYIDSTGLSVLFETLRAPKEQGHMTIVGPQPRILKLMELTGLIDRSGVNVYPDLASAVAALGSLEETRRLLTQPASEPGVPLGINRGQRGMWSSG